MTTFLAAPYLLSSKGLKVGYARVSTADQNLERQLSVLNQIGCDEIFSDHGVSGKKIIRPGLDDALKLLGKGDMLIVYKLDRLGRSVTHLATLLEYFASNEIHFCSLTEGLDTSTSGGRMIYHIFAAVAEFHRDLIYENTMHGLKVARENGRIGGRKFILNQNDVKSAYKMITTDGIKFEAVAKVYGVSRITLQRAFKRYKFY